MDDVNPWFIGITSPAWPLFQAQAALRRGLLPEQGAPTIGTFVAPPSRLARGARSALARSASSPGLLVPQCRPRLPSHAAGLCSPQTWSIQCTPVTGRRGWALPLSLEKSSKDASSEAGEWVTSHDARALPACCRDGCEAIGEQGCPCGGGKASQLI